MIKILVVFLLLTSVSACGKKKDEAAEILFSKGVKYLDKQKWESATTKFQEIDDKYAFSELANRSQILSVYAHYMAKKYDDAIRMADYYLKFNPSDRKYGEYLYYMKFLSYYKQIKPYDRDQKNSFTAIGLIDEMKAKYGENPYIADANDKKPEIMEYVIGSRMGVARFYIKREDFLPALVILNEVENGFGEGKYSAELYFRLAEIYYYLGIDTEYKKAKSIMETKYNESYWYKKLPTK